MGRLSPTRKRWLLGAVAGTVLLFELLSLWSFTTQYFVSNRGVLFGVPFVTFTIPPLGLVLALGLGVVAAVHASGREDVPAAVEAGLRQVGELTGVVDPDDAVVTGAIEYNNVRWQGSVLDQSTVTDIRRQCPHCRRDLTDAHLPASSLRNQSGDSDQDADGRPASLVSTVVRMVADTDTVDADIVEARACPHCDFAVANTQGETGNRAEVESTILHHASAILRPDGTPQEALVEVAADRGTGMTRPGDIWDAYVLHTDHPELSFIHIDEGGGTRGRSTVESYPAFEDLRDRSSVAGDALEYAVPDGLKPLIAHSIDSTYLSERAALLDERERTRNALVRGLRTLDKQVGDAIHDAQLAASRRERPDYGRSLQNAIEHARTELEALNRRLDEDFLTYGEQHRLSRLRRRIARSDEYLTATLSFARERTALESEIESFDETYDPYRSVERYMPTREQDALRKQAHDVRTALLDLKTKTTFEHIPVTDEEWLLETHDAFIEHCTRLANYNEGHDSFEGFIDREIARYDDLLRSEYGDLNPEQREAVVKNDVYNIVDASAGTGKTLTLTKRVEYLQARGVDLDDVLVLTFSTDARRKLETDILEGVDAAEDGRDLHVYNFHGFTSEIIADARGRGLGDWDRDATMEAFATGFVDADADADATNAAYAEDYPEAMAQFEEHQSAYDDLADEPMDAETVVRFLKAARNFAVTANDVEAMLTEAKRQQYHFGMAAAAVLRTYRQAARDRLEPVDELDKIETATRIIRDHPEAFADRYEHILVDEFQDVSEPDVDLVTSLLEVSERDTRLFVVGDAWQSIYGFRGSNPGFFTEFEDRFDSVARTVLETNYRCPKAVVHAGRDLMHDNYHTPKPAVPHDDNPEYTPRLYPIEGEYAFPAATTARRVIDAYLDDPDTEPRDVLVLASSVDNSDAVEQLSGFLQAEGHHISNKPSRPGITITTIHKSKGEDAECVILLDAFEGGSSGLPAREYTDELIEPATQPTITTLKEKRRLCYVALTRSAGELHVFTNAEKVSPFIQDIEHHFDHRPIGPGRILTGTITELSTSDERCTGRLECEELGTTLQFAVDTWALDSDTFDSITEELEAESRYRLTDVRMTHHTPFEDLEFTAATTLEQLDDTPDPSAIDEPGEPHAE